uniref:Uncharacterized protein n=1 Tax=Arundo donax TaxID=35708 RepID=A0A0A9AAU4_ARUDO
MSGPGPRGPSPWTRRRSRSNQRHAVIPKEGKWNSLVHKPWRTGLQRGSKFRDPRTQNRTQ